MRGVMTEGFEVDRKNLAIALLIGLLAGWIASFVPFTGGEGGLVQYLVSGVLGSFVGSFVLQRTGITLGIHNEIARDTATATIGAVIVMFIANLLT
jgi:uncharacterized membrane protein YeaQ/YmgE (transglycosylase-associated protein family)